MDTPPWTPGCQPCLKMKMTNSMIMLNTVLTLKPPRFLPYTKGQPKAQVLHIYIFVTIKYILLIMFSLTYTRTEMMNKKWKWVKTDLIFFIQLKKRYNVYVRLKSWPFEIRSSWSCCIKIFLDAIANQLRHNVCFVAHIPRWHTSISLSEEPFGCRSQGTGKDMGISRKIFMKIQGHV